MEIYENDDIYCNFRHKVEVTFQYLNFKNTIEYYISGNCLGLEILNHFDPDDLGEAEIDDLNSNEAKIQYVEQFDGYRMVLKNNEGKELELHIDGDELGNYVSAIAIVDCEKVLENDY